MSQLSIPQAVARLFASGTAALEKPGERPLTIRAESIDATVVVGTGPRLRLATGAELVGRVVGDDSTPWEIAFVVEEAEYESAELARVTLRADRVGVDSTKRRRTARVPVGGLAWLVAVNCAEVVDGDRVDGTLTDLSEGGVAFATSRLLRRGDRLTLHGRFFADTLHAEVRVAAVRASSSAGRQIVGCQFIDVTEQTVATIRRILNPQAEGRARGIDTASLREALVEERAPVWKRVFGRG